jgi:predicted Holliday junction resolvase-like endonuclease
MLALFGPAAWAIFGGRQMVVGIFKFLTTPLGQVVAVAAALLVTAVATDVHARIRDRAVCNQRVDALNGAWQERELQAKATYDQARSTRDQSITEAVEKRAAAQTNSIQEIADRLGLQVKAYEASTPHNPACRVTPRLVDQRKRMLDRKK